MSPPRAGITFSILLRPDVPTARLAWLPLLAGVALAEAVGRVAVVDAVLKWPNDLLVRSASREGPYGKCGGILAEAVDQAVVLGIGVNVSQDADELPPPVQPGAPPPTSLALAGAATTDRDPLVRAVVRALTDWYSKWRAAGGDASACGLRAAYIERCDSIGQDVEVTLPGGEVLVGRASDVDEEGRLLVDANGDVRAVSAGDVRHVRRHHAGHDS